jgi:hypothetical protein
LDLPLQIIPEKTHPSTNKKKKRSRAKRISVSDSANGDVSALQSWYCEAHNKKLEAFCDLDKKMLCIDCILNENHKNHEIMALEKAATL